MLYSKSLNTQKLINLAMAEPDYFYEVSNGEKTVSVFMAGNGINHWAVNRRKASEEEVAEILAQWAVEGVSLDV